MKWAVEFRASEQPEEWCPLRKPGGNSLTFPAQDVAEQRMIEFVKLQPHVPARVVPIYA